MLCGYFCEQYGLSDICRTESKSVQEPTCFVLRFFGDVREKSRMAMTEGKD